MLPNVLALRLLVPVLANQRFSQGAQGTTQAGQVHEWPSALAPY